MGRAAHRVGPADPDAARLMARRAARPRRRPGDFTWRAPDPLLLALYNAADRASGEERRELLRLAAELRQAIDAKAEELGQPRGAAERRLGMLLL